jgi:hypothetical protein
MNDLKKFYNDNLPYYYNVNIISSKIKNAYRPQYKTNNFVEDYHLNSVENIHYIDDLESKVRKIIQNMFEPVVFDDIPEVRKKKKKMKFVEGEKSESVLSSMFSKKSDNTQVENVIDLERLKKAFITEFFNPLHKMTISSD